MFSGRWEMSRKKPSMLLRGSYYLGVISIPFAVLVAFFSDWMVHSLLVGIASPDRLWCAIVGSWSILVSISKFYAVGRHLRAISVPVLEEVVIILVVSTIFLALVFIFRHEALSKQIQVLFYISAGVIALNGVISCYSAKH